MDKKKNFHCFEQINLDSQLNCRKYLGPKFFGAAQKNVQKCLNGRMGLLKQTASSTVKRLYSHLSLTLRVKHLASQTLATETV